jgi:hypothetical protein
LVLSSMQIALRNRQKTKTRPVQAQSYFPRGEVGKDD